MCHATLCPARMNSRNYVYLGLFFVALAAIPIVLIVLFGTDEVDWNSFATNFSTEMIGAAFTVAIVGFIALRIESQRDNTRQTEIQRGLGKLALEFATRVPEKMKIGQGADNAVLPQSETDSSLAEFDTDMESDEVADALYRLSHPELSSFLDYLWSYKLRWQAFYDRHSENLDVEDGSKMLQLSIALDAIWSNVDNFSQIASKAERNWKPDHSDLYDGESLNYRIHEEQELSSKIRSFELIRLQMECVELAIRTEIISSSKWTIASLEQARDKVSREQAEFEKAEFG